MSKPKQYEQGWVEFFKLRFKVNEDVLIPRPETELLVDKVIKADPRSVIDVGTGSGNVAISIARNLAEVKVTATEVSEKALKVAEQNAKLHGVESKIEFLVSDLLEEVSDNSNFDFLVANLPYIPTERIEYLDSSVKDFEPRIALDGGSDGFGLYRKLFASMVRKNITCKYLIAEIDYTHSYIAVNEALKYFPKSSVDIKKDLANMQRFLVIGF